MRLNEAFRKLNITVDLIPEGSSNRPGTRLQPTHITIHNTANGAKTATAAFHAEYVKGADARQRQVSWHFTVDDKQAFKHLPTTEVGWHAKDGNTRSLGIEICEYEGIDKKAALERASLLTAVLMFQLSIPVERVVTHRSWTGKHCPHLLLDQEGGFDAFRRQVADALEQLQFTSAGPTPAGAMLLDEALVPSPVDQVPLAPVMAGAPLDVVEHALGRMDGEHTAELERLVGRLTVENEALRRSLRELRNSLLETD